MIIQESTIENIPSISRPSSPQLSDLSNDLQSTEFVSTNTADLSELPTSTYPTFEESVRSVDSASPSIMAEDELFTSKPASPVLDTVPDSTEQMYEPEHGTLYDLPNELYEIPDIPDREYTSLSPIFEESSVSAISRAASAMAGDDSRSLASMSFSRSASPEVSRAAPMDHPQSQYEDSFESRDYEDTTSAGALLPTIAEMVPEDLRQEPQSPALGPLLDSHQSEAQLPPTEYEKQPEAPSQQPAEHTVQSELTTTELESENGRDSEEDSFMVREPDFVPTENDLKPESQEDEPVNEETTYHELEAQDDNKKLSMEDLPLINEDIFPEPANIPLPGDGGTWDHPTEVPAEPIVWVQESNIEQPIEEQTLKYALPSDIEPEHSSHYSSFIEAPLQTLEPTSVLAEPENVPLPEDSPILMPEEPETTLNFEGIEESVTVQKPEEPETAHKSEVTEEPATVQRPEVIEVTEATETPDPSPEPILPEYTFETENESRRQSMETKEGPDLESLPNFEGFPTSVSEPRMTEILEGGSNSESEDLSKEKTTLTLGQEPTTTEAPEQCQEMVAGGPSEENAFSDYTLKVESEQESMSGPDLDAKPASPVVENIEEYMEPEFFELPNEDSIPPLSSTAEPATTAEVVETEPDDRSHGKQPDYELQEEPEFESIIRRFSVEGAQILPLPMNDDKSPTPEINIAPPEDTVDILPSMPMESEEIHEIQDSTGSITQNVFEPIVAQQIEEQSIHQQRYNTPPPLEVQVSWLY